MELADIQTMQDILGFAFRIPYDKPIATYWPNQGRRRVLQLHDAPALVRCYDIQKNVVIIRTNDAAYVIPYTERIEEILILRGFVMRGMYVPFSNGDYPIDMKDRYDKVFKHNTNKA